MCESSAEKPQGGGGGRGFVLEVISGEISCRTLVGEGEEESDNG